MLETNTNNAILEDIIKKDYYEKCITDKQIYMDFADKVYIDCKDLKELFIIQQIIDCNPVIIKCPILEISRKYITLNVKDRNKDHSEITETGAYSFTTRESYNQIKIDKNDLNSNFGYRASTSYPRPCLIYY